MKTLLFILLTISSTALMAAEEKDAKKKSEVYGDVIVNDTLAKMLEVKGVKAKYETCKTDNPAFSENITTCLWKALTPDEQKAVKAVYNSEQKITKKLADDENKRDPASTKKAPENLTARRTAVDVNYETNPAVAALSKFYGDKLDEILDPNKALTEAERKEGKILVIDHRKFIDLYKSELGKTIVNAFTSYCLDTDPATCGSSGLCKIADKKEDQKEHREANLASLKNIDLKGDSAASEKWSNCILSVPKVCDEKAKATDTSKQRACLIVDYVKAARKNIMIADQQKEFYNDLAKNSSGFGIAQNTKVIDDENKTAADALLEITSKDVKDSLKAVNEKNLKELEGCYDGVQSKIVNIEACKKFLSTNTDTNKAAFLEFGMRQLAQEENLKTELDSEVKVREYLKEEGYKDDEIKKLTENKESVEKTKEQILSRFKEEKAAIIKEMAQKIKDKTADTDGTIVDNQENKTKIEKIRDEISNRSTDLANLVQFNNIVASYLNITETGTNKSERNTASLFAESKAMGKEGEELKKKIDEAQLKDKKNSADLDVGTINKMLKYEEVQKAKAP